MSASLRILSSKADSNTWESFTRSELKLKSVHQESPRSDIFRKRATKPLLKQKHLTWTKEKKNWTVAQWSKVLFSDKSTFCISFGNQGPRVWRKIWAAMSSAGVGNCVLSSPQSTQPSTRRIWSTLCFHLLTSFMEMLISFSSKILAPAHTAKTNSKWFADHDITVLDWPANMPDLNPIWNLWDIFKRKMRNSRSNNPDELKAQLFLIRATG